MIGIINKMKWYGWFCVAARHGVQADPLSLSLHPRQTHNEGKDGEALEVESLTVAAKAQLGDGVAQAVEHRRGDSLGGNLRGREAGEGR